MNYAQVQSAIATIDSFLTGGNLRGPANPFICGYLTNLREDHPSDEEMTDTDRVALEAIRHRLVP